MSIRKANYKRLLTFVLAMCMLMGVSLTASAAHQFDFTIPYPYSARYTVVYTKKTNATPYVQLSVCTIPTVFYLAPDGSVSTAATDPIIIDDTDRHYFTWKNWYGGIGSSYRLVAYPAVMSDYEPYTVRGQWAE